MNHSFFLLKIFFICIAIHFVLKLKEFWIIFYNVALLNSTHYESSRIQILVLLFHKTTNFIGNFKRIPYFLAPLLFFSTLRPIILFVKTFAIRLVTTMLPFEDLILICFARWSHFDSNLALRQRVACCILLFVKELSDERLL